MIDNDRAAEDELIEIIAALGGTAKLGFIHSRQIKFATHASRFRKRRIDARPLSLQVYLITRSFIAPRSHARA